jgi:hypothetical protein
LEQIVRQCIDKGLVKGKRQIIDSTPVIANISSSSITGLVRKCRENVLKTVEKQDVKIAERLGLKELQNAEQVKFASTEEGLQKEIEAARFYLLLYYLTREPSALLRSRLAPCANDG